MVIDIRTGLLVISVSLASIISFSACSSDDSAGSDDAAGDAGAGAAGTGEGGDAEAGTGGAGVNDTPAGSRTISATEGGIVTEQGLVLNIPPGALDEDTHITVDVSDGAGLPAEDTLVASVYDLGPNGTMFKKPVTLTLDFDAKKLGKRQPVISYLADNAWIPLSDSEVSGKTVRATTTHFTQFSVVATDDAGAGTSGGCGAATSGLSQVADPGAPVLDAMSFLQRVDSNDAYCSGTVGSGQLSTFGPYGFQLTVRFADAENDGPMTLDDAHVAGVLRLASDPNIDISTRTDQKRWGGGSDSIAIQLCLPKAYAASELTVGFDLADKAGHRSKAICIRQQSGF